MSSGMQLASSEAAELTRVAADATCLLSPSVVLHVSAGDVDCEELLTQKAAGGECERGGLR